MRYICELYLDAYFGNTDANAHFNGETEFLRKTIPSGYIDYVVFDVGANVGNWTLDALAINPALQIHCFEPVASTYETLRVNVPTTVRCNKLALGAQVGTRVFHVYGNGSVHNSFYQHRQFRTSTVNNLSIDTVPNYCERENIAHIDFLKIDVEGAELEVLMGAQPLLAEREIDLIQLEYGSKWIDARVFLKDLYEFLEPYGYYIWKLIPGGKLQSVHHYDYRLEQFRHATFVLTARENASQPGDHRR